MKYTKLLIEINNDSIKRIKGEWDTFTDNGEDFKDIAHYYSEDLDLFGKKSLFQWTNTAKTYTGRQNLGKFLREVAGNIEDIQERQVAVNELSTMLNWRQRFLAEGMVVSDKMNDTRDTEAVKRIATAYLKLLFPNVREPGDITVREFKRYCLDRARKMRDTIKYQLGVLDEEYRGKDIPVFTVRPDYDDQEG